MGFSIEAIVDTTIVFPTSVSIDNARVKTLEICRRMAIEKVVPSAIDIYSHFNRNQVEINEYYSDETVLSSFIISTQSGYIVDEKILDTQFAHDAGASIFQYQLKLRTDVKPVTGIRDPSIHLKIETEDNSLSNGDELILYITSSHDGFLYLFHFFRDNTVELFFPNHIEKNNEIKSNSLFRIPNNKTIKYGVKTYPDEEITTETIIGVFTKILSKELEKFIRIGAGKNNTSIREDSYIKFQNWLANIPLDQRFETTIQIHITN